MEEEEEKVQEKTPEELREATRRMFEALGDCV